MPCFFRCHRPLSPGTLCGRHFRPIRAPRVSTRCLFVLDPDGHRAEPLQQPALGTYRPPVVQEDLERAPHCNPATNQEPFANDSRKTTVAEVAGDEVAKRYGRGQKCQRDDETDATTTEQLPKSPARGDDSLTEVLVNRVAQGRSFIGSTRRP